MADIVVLIILGLAVFLVLRDRIRTGKQTGGGCSCGGDRTSCRSCKKAEGRKDKRL